VKVEAADYSETSRQGNLKSCHWLTGCELIRNRAHCPNTALNDSKEKVWAQVPCLEGKGYETVDRNSVLIKYASEKGEIGTLLEMTAQISLRTKCEPLNNLSSEMSGEHYCLLMAVRINCELLCVNLYHVAPWFIQTMWKTGLV
jgi:hypothetical protein